MPEDAAVSVFTRSDRALLDRPLNGMLTIAPGPGRLPAPRPVWFEAAPDGTVALFSFASAAKVRRLAADPRASFVVVTPTGEPEAWVSVEADATVHDDGAADLAARLAGRYWDMTEDRHHATIEEWGTTDLVRIVLHPRRVTRGPA